ncbi:hypothetical protein [Pelagibius sp.]|uniref:hypothetical protein n=1 Tax=Pelagibius sp. TaxID=1931238 RepID=UPI00261C32FA|nr:hypothetical protein [Pelagibius sp.]
MVGGGIDFETENWLARHWLRLRRRAGTFTLGQRLMLREGKDQLLGRVLALAGFVAVVSLLDWLA